MAIDAKARQVAAVLEKFLGERKMTRNKFSRLIGVSPAVISQFLSGKYRNNLDELMNKIISTINDEQRKAQGARHQGSCSG